MTGKWQFDALKVMLAFKTHLGIESIEWTQADADALEQYSSDNFLKLMNGISTSAIIDAIDKTWEMA